MKHNESLKVAFADDDKRRASVFSASEAGSEYCKRTKYNGPLTGKREWANLIIYLRKKSLFEVIINREVF